MHTLKSYFALLYDSTIAACMFPYSKYSHVYKDFVLSLERHLSLLSLMNANELFQCDVNKEASFMCFISILKPAHWK